MLFHCKYKFLNHVFEELIVIGPCRLRLLDPCIDREEPRLIELLRLNKGSDPVLLPFLKIFNDVLLIHQVFFILTEVLGANIFNFVKLLVILLLEIVSVR
jgi:hypothetical protein